MTKWLYIRADGHVCRPHLIGAIIAQRGYPLETVGARELELMLRARRSWHGQLTIPHDRAHNAERMALRRLVQRGLFSEPNYVGGAPSSWKQGRNRPVWLYVYTLTDRGRECWLRTREEA